ncbi:unnamed protein product, partial [Prorocentrum cordatum]
MEPGKRLDSSCVTSGSRVLVKYAGERERHERPLVRPASKKMYAKCAGVSLLGLYLTGFKGIARVAGQFSGLLSTRANGSQTAESLVGTASYLSHAPGFGAPPTFVETNEALGEREAEEEVNRGGHPDDGGAPLAAVSFAGGAVPLPRPGRGAWRVLASSRGGARSDAGGATCNRCVKAESLGLGRIVDGVVAFRCDVEEGDGFWGRGVLEGPGAHLGTAAPTELDARLLNVTRHSKGFATKHEVAMRGLEHVVLYDQLNVGKLACTELPWARAQPSELKHKEKLLLVDAANGYEANEYRHMVTNATRGQVMVGPVLEECVSSHLQTEGSVLMERWKRMEHRDLIRHFCHASTPSSSDAMAYGFAAKREHAAQSGQRDVGSTMNVPRKLFPILLPFPATSIGDFLDSSAGYASIKWRLWANKTTRSISRMCGCSDFDSGSSKPSAGQMRVLERTSKLVASSGPPTCTSAGAFHELCGARAGQGYDMVDAPRARCQPGLVLLPKEGGLTDGSSCLRGAALDFGADGRWECARFCSSLFNANMLELGGYEGQTVGVFFVSKKDHALRLILDTRPQQVFVRLPPVDVESLRALNPVAARGLSGKRATPRLCVLAMGWPWSLYFCQEMASTAATSAGFTESDMLLDKRASPNFRELESDATRAAVYVGNVGVFGQEKPSVDLKAHDALVALERAGLACKGVEPAGGRQEFTGLLLDSDSGSISVTSKRLWRVLLACLRALGLGRMMGRELQLLVAHFPWAAVMRRELLALPRACYRFIEEAGDARWKLWGSVKTELRMMCSLIVFAFTDARRSCSPIVTATDASTGEDGSDFGGFAVVQREAPVADVSRACRIAEGWRHLVDDAIDARRHALEAYELADARMIGSCACVGAGALRSASSVSRGVVRSWESATCFVVLKITVRIISFWATARPAEPLPTDMATAYGAPAWGRRRQQRRAAHLESAQLCREQGATFLEVCSVRGATADLYDAYLATFERWAGIVICERRTGELVAYLMGNWEYPDSEGENHSAASKLLAALEYRYLRLRKGCQSLRSVALALLICSLGCPKPSQLVKLKGPLLVAPAACSATRHWMLLPSPAEGNVGSKTDEFNENVALDQDAEKQLGPRFFELKHKASQGMLWTFDQLLLSEHAGTLAELSGVSMFRPHPHCLRHRRASYDSLTKRQTFEHIKRQERWKSNASVSRYSQHVRVASKAIELALAVHRYGTSINQ